MHNRQELIIKVRIYAEHLLLVSAIIFFRSKEIINQRIRPHHRCGNAPVDLITHCFPTGISKAKEILQWLSLIKEELGDRWLQPDLFRVGASSLLADIERQLEFHLTGRYSALHRHPMG